MIKMRLIEDAFKQIKKEDPDTNITLYGLRTIVKSGVIPTVKLGRKTLINYDSLLEYFKTGNTVEVPKGTIRKAG